MTDSRGRMKERKVSQEGKKHKRRLQHAEGERAESWRQGDLTSSQMGVDRVRTDSEDSTSVR